MRVLFYTIVWLCLWCNHSHAILYATNVQSPSFFRTGSCTLLNDKKEEINLHNEGLHDLPPKGHCHLLKRTRSIVRLKETMEIVYIPGKSTNQSSDEWFKMLGTTTHVHEIVLPFKYSRCIAEMAAVSIIPALAIYGLWKIR